MAKKKSFELNKNRHCFAELVIVKSKNIIIINGHCIDQRAESPIKIQGKGLEIKSKTGFKIIGNSIKYVQVEKA